MRPALAKAAALAALGASTAAAPPGPASREQGLWIGPIREPIANGKLQVTTTGPDSARIVAAARGLCPAEAAQ